MDLGVLTTTSHYVSKSSLEFCTRSTMYTNISLYNMCCPLLSGIVRLKGVVGWARPAVGKVGILLVLIKGEPGIVIPA